MTMPRTRTRTNARAPQRTRALTAARLRELEEPVAALHARQLDGLDAQELPALRTMLQTIGRARPA